jgi:DNA-directed RNA polymerase subunit RPC12/RpoP
MLTLITCPTCHHKFTVPEGSMGQRSTCPNCQSIFVAGKSVAESDGRMNGGPRRGLLERAAGEGQVAQSAPLPLDKTMLGEVDAPIRYNCPRCKKPLESPASEAGTKKPCPYCSGRLQVPAAPARPAVDPGLNKTLLGECTDQPATSPTAMAVSAVQPAAPAPVATVPSAGTGLNRTHKYLIGGLAAAGLFFAVLYFNGKHQANVEYERAKAEYDRQKQEDDKRKGDIAQLMGLIQQQQQQMAQQQKQWEEERARQQREWKEDREREEKRLAILNDEKQKADAKAKLDQKHRELEDEKKRAEEAQTRRERETQDRLDALKRQLDNANKNNTTIIAPAQPPVYYPWWHHYYGRYPW